MSKYTNILGGFILGAATVFVAERVIKGNINFAQIANKIKQQSSGYITPDEYQEEIPLETEKVVPSPFESDRTKNDDSGKYATISHIGKLRSTPLPADQIVSTDMGDKKIEDIKAGDTVITSDGNATVINVIDHTKDDKNEENKIDKEEKKDHKKDKKKDKKDKKHHHKEDDVQHPDDELIDAIETISSECENDPLIPIIKEINND